MRCSPRTAQHASNAIQLLSTPRRTPIPSSTNKRKYASVTGTSTSTFTSKRTRTQPIETMEMKETSIALKRGRGRKKAESETETETLDIVESKDIDPTVSSTSTSTFTSTSTSTSTSASKRSRKKQPTTEPVVETVDPITDNTTTAPTTTATTTTAKTTVKSGHGRTKTVIATAITETKEIDTSTSTSSEPIWRMETVSREEEEKLWEQGYTHICGVDEAGRGPLAGPVVAAAVIIPRDVYIAGIHDSKILTVKEREYLYHILTTHPKITYSTCILDEKIIDSINILQATLRAMSTCVSALTTTPDYILIDGNRLPSDMNIPAHYVIRGDSTCYNIAAASIIAKVTRDRIMQKYHHKWPQYGFATHKGYGVASHIAAIRQHGPCEIHRRTFAPIKHMILREESVETPTVDDDADATATTTSTRSRRIKAVKIDATDTSIESTSTTKRTRRKR